MHEDTLSTIFSALADPTRRAILQRLARGDASVTELAQPFDMTVRAISKHVAILERAGLIVRGKDAFAGIGFGGRFPRAHSLSNWLF